MVQLAIAIEWHLFTRGYNSRLGFDLENLDIWNTWSFRRGTTVFLARAAVPSPLTPLPPSRLVAEPGEGHGRPRPALFLNQTEAWRAEIFFLEDRPPLSKGLDDRPPPYLKVWIRALSTPATQAIVSLCRSISDKTEVATIAIDKGKILEIKARVIANSINFFNQR